MSDFITWQDNQMAEGASKKNPAPPKNGSHAESDIQGSGDPMEIKAVAQKAENWDSIDKDIRYLLDLFAQNINYYDVMDQLTEQQDSIMERSEVDCFYFLDHGYWPADSRDNEPTKGSDLNWSSAAQSSEIVDVMDSDLIKARMSVQAWDHMKKLAHRSSFKASIDTFLTWVEESGGHPLKAVGIVKSI